MIDTSYINYGKDRQAQLLAEAEQYHRVKSLPNNKPSLAAWIRITTAMALAALMSR